MQIRRSNQTPGGLKIYRANRKMKVQVFLCVQVNSVLALVVLDKSEVTESARVLEDIAELPRVVVWVNVSVPSQSLGGSFHLPDTHK